jgi:hypothetical protein
MTNITNRNYLSSDKEYEIKYSIPTASLIQNIIVIERVFYDRRDYGGPRNWGFSSFFKKIPGKKANFVSNIKGATLPVNKDYDDIVRIGSDAVVGTLDFDHVELLGSGLKEAKYLNGTVIYLKEIGDLSPEMKNKIKKYQEEMENKIKKYQEKNGGNLFSKSKTIRRKNRKNRKNRKSRKSRK